MCTNRELKQKLNELLDDDGLVGKLREVLLGGRLEKLAQRSERQLERLERVVDLLHEARELGIIGAYPNRQTALEAFFSHLDGYVTRPGSKLFIVGSSLKGVLEKVPQFGDRLRTLADDAQGRSGEKRLFVLLTHPTYSRYREKQEEREQGAIADEIFQCLRMLQECGVARESVKLYKGTPTVFMIATEEEMLLNPYPYGKEAYEMFCLRVRGARSDDIYHQWMQNHFHAIWNGLRGTALNYKYAHLYGPKPGVPPLPEGPDFFVIQDASEFYLAVFLKGENGIPRTVEYSPPPSGGAAEEPGGPEQDAKSRASIPDVWHLGDQFEVRLLKLRDGGRNGEWVTFQGGDVSKFDKGQRKGRMMGLHPGNIHEYQMLGVFSPDGGPQNPYLHESDIPFLKGKNLPWFWYWLPELRR